MSSSGRRRRRGKVEEGGRERTCIRLQAVVSEHEGGKVSKAEGVHVEGLRLCGCHNNVFSVLAADRVLSGECCV